MSAICCPSLEKEKRMKTFNMTLTCVYKPCLPIDMLSVYMYAGWFVQLDALGFGSCNNVALTYLTLV